MKILLYTFRTFPDDLLGKYGLENTFRFGKLHEDIAKYEKIIASKKPEAIIGFSLSRSSRQEMSAINRFNLGLIDKDGPTEIKLSPIESSLFPASTSPTHTFCNWTIYKIARNHKVSFYHLREEDFGKFVRGIKKLAS